MRKFKLILVVTFQYVIFNPDGKINFLILFIIN
jgi:hypothetical protein